MQTTNQLVPRLRHGWPSQGANLAAHYSTESSVQTKGASWHTVHTLARALKHVHTKEHFSRTALSLSRRVAILILGYDGNAMRLATSYPRARESSRGTSLSQ